MTTNEVQDFMQRIKSHYQEFIIDEFKFNEWYNELKEYDSNDINKKFEEHLKSETYGNYIPKINFLTKGLRKIGEPGIDKSQIYVRCGRCSKTISLDKKNEHDNLCIDIDFMNFLSEKYLGKPIDKEKCFQMPRQEFYEKFKKALTYSTSKEPNEEELARLKEIYQIVQIEEQ